MRLQYRHLFGYDVLEAPSGASYRFAADASGRRVADFADDDLGDRSDAAWFLSLTNAVGEPLFAEIEASPEFEPFDPAAKNYDRIGTSALRSVYRDRFGKAAPSRVNDQTLIDALRAADVIPLESPPTDADADASAEAEPA